MRKRTVTVLAFVGVLLAMTVTLTNWGDELLRRFSGFTSISQSPGSSAAEVIQNPLRAKPLLSRAPLAVADDAARDQTLFTTASYYMNTATPENLGSLGCTAGVRNSDRPQIHDDLIILMFGAPKEQDGQEGTLLYRTPGATSVDFPSTADIAKGTEAFISNYLSCTDQNAHLKLVLGTSNWGTQVTKEHGIAWGSMVNDVSAWISEVNSTDRASVFGGSDIEADWSAPSIARAWVDGYLSVNPLTLYNFGDAAGCPTADTGGSQCNNGWTQEDVWYVSWGSGGRQPIPQIYNAAQAREWYQLKKFSLTKTAGGSRPMVIAGVLTEDGACHQGGGCPPNLGFTPDEGYQHLSDLLNARPETAQPLPYSTDIRKAWLP